jgi:putative MATE family efflux protein
MDFCMSSPFNQELVVPARPAAEPAGTWSIIRQALRGSSIDYTSAPVGQAILMLAVPMVMEMAMESIFAVADVFWVAHLGADAVATVGLTESMMTIIYTLAIGLSIGATAVVARRTGERDRDGAASAAVQSILLGLVVSGAIAAIGIRDGAALLRLMGATDAVIATGSPFTRVLLGGNATVVLLFLINAVFRGAGDAAIAMRVLWLGNAINIALGPCLIFGLGPFPALGVKGAAIATTIGRGTAVVCQLAILCRGAGRVAVTRRAIRVDRAAMATIVRLSGSGTLQTLLTTASYVALIRILAGFGSAMLAGYTIAIRVIIFGLLPSFGISNAASTMVGQNLGAGRADRAEEAVWKAVRFNVVFLGIVGALFLAAAGSIVAVFTGDPEVQPFAALSLRVVSLGFVFYASGMVLTASFNGAGDTWTPTWINVFIFWLFEIPLAWVLAHRTGFGALGVPAALAAAYSTLAVVSAVFFKRGKWRRMKI